jgi:ribonuclease E
MGTHILMNVVDEHELRVGVISDGRLAALLHERMGDGQHLGNIYKARVANVEPSLDAAFLDLGGQKNGFIHVDELIREDLPKRSGKRIEEILKAGDEILVQIVKESIKDKGPNMSMYTSLPGRYLVMMHSEQAKGVSKRIEDQAVRRRLKKLLDAFTPPEGMGFIVRTAAATATEAEIQLDYEFLKRVWAEVAALGGRVSAPFCVYQEADVVVRTLRDLASADVEAVVIDQEKLYDEARAFSQIFMPELADRIQLHRDELPIFTFYGLEERIAALYDRKVDLPSGGAIVIEQTEALVSIDVNSAKNRDSGNVEQTALMTNLEAAGAIAEQLVLRDLGGLIIIDFIDMEDGAHRKQVQLALRRALASDKAKLHVSPMSRFGLVEMSRSRTRPSHKLLSSQECPWCQGTGSIKTAETFGIDVMRGIRQMLHSRSLSRLEVVVPGDLAVVLQNDRRRELHDLEERTDCRIVVTADALMKAREHRLVPTFRKGERATRDRQGQRVQPVRPSLLAPLMAEQAKAIALAKELAAMKPDELERELNTDPGERPAAPDIRAATPAKPVERVVVEVPRQATVWDDAAVLRRLLFSPATPVHIAPPATAPAPSGASQPRSGSGQQARRRRRR